MRGAWHPPQAPPLKNISGGVVRAGLSHRKRIGFPVSEHVFLAEKNREKTTLDKIFFSYNFKLKKL